MPCIFCSLWRSLYPALESLNWKVIRKDSTLKTHLLGSRYCPLRMNKRVHQPPQYWCFSNIHPIWFSATSGPRSYQWTGDNQLIIRHSLSAHCLSGIKIKPGAGHILRPNLVPIFLSGHGRRIQQVWPKKLMCKIRPLLCWNLQWNDWLVVSHIESLLLSHSLIKCILHSQESRGHNPWHRGR